MINHPAHESLVTRLYFKDDPYLRGEEDLTLVLEEVQGEESDKGFISGFQFVLSPK